MRRARFVAIIAHTPECRSHWEVGLQALVSSASEVRWVLKGAHVLVVARGNFAVTPGEQAIFIGSIFERGSSRHAAIPKRAGDFGFASLARHLIEHHWGGYVAIHEDRANQSVTALRAPLGDLPCFWSECDGAVMLGSDLSLMEAAGLSRPTIDRQALARYLVKEDVLTGETCLSGVREIRGGEMLTFAGAEPTQEILWSPWTFASASSALEDAREGQRQIRDAALLCVDSLARDQSGTVLKLSGGIDSSIVAACLKEGGHKFTAVNLVTKDPSGDERKQARLVAKSLSVPLIEAYRQVDRVALERSAAAGRPRPCARSFTQETSRICTEVAEATGSSALFDGGGGDNVFSSLQSARPAADALLRHGPGRLFWRTAADIAGLAQVNLWKVARSALGIAWRKGPAYRWDEDMRFLSIDARAQAVGAGAHPWLVPPPGSHPGKCAHVALIAAAQSVIESFDPNDRLPTYSPLIVQPLVEASLRIPSWHWFEAGRNRAAARRAFASYLPSATLERRSKGAPDSFIAQIYEANRPAISAMLMDGMLMHFGLLDRRALGTALKAEGPVRGHNFLRIMRLVDAEAWARSRASAT